MSQNNITTNYIGVDVAKKSLDLSGLGRSKELPNDAKGHRRFLSLLAKSAQPVHVILERTIRRERGSLAIRPAPEDIHQTVGDQFGDLL